MSVTVTTSRSGNTTIVTAVSTLTAPTFYWYLDGIFVGATQGGVRTFVSQPNDQQRIEVLDSTDPAFDPAANAPAGYPARRMLVFTRSIDPSVIGYRIEQQRAGGSWSSLGTVQDDRARWLYEFLTPRLDDLTQYAWRVIPMDEHGNDGTPVTLVEELIVRTPDAPNFAVAYNAGTQKVTFSQA